jgi:PTS system cellobiose-specific IIA component
MVVAPATSEGQDLSAFRKFVIVNADDFGYSHGINRGIAVAHERGVVTSASMVVNGRAVDEAAALAQRYPQLAVGLHVNFTNEAESLFDLESQELCRQELRAQFERFLALMGTKPTHIDSHQHVHRHHMRRPLFEELAVEEGVPMRDCAPVTFKGGFYGQWEYGVFDPSKVSLEALMSILSGEIHDGIYELSCHPGYYDPALTAVYHKDREHELRTLTDPRLPRLVAELGIRLISYRDLPAAAAALDVR